MEESIAIDPARAFQELQQLHGQEMARLAGDIATKNACINVLLAKNTELNERITALEQNAGVSNGAVQGGADLSKLERNPKAPASLRKVEGEAGGS